MGEENRELVLDKAAEEELVAAVSWYEQRKPGVGEDFLVAVEATFELIQRFPQIGRLRPADAKERRVRKLSVEGFPFSVMYREMPNGIYVVAIAHDRRRPGYWRRR